MHCAHRILLIEGRSQGEETKASYRRSGRHRLHEQ